jgi:hypothetical protein
MCAEALENERVTLAAVRTAASLMQRAAEALK